MAYVNRDEKGRIVGIFANQQYEGQEFVEGEVALHQDYRLKRLAEYPEVGDQLDELMKWLATETEINIPAKLKSIAMKCMSVKAQHPKDED